MKPFRAVHLRGRLLGASVLGVLALALACPALANPTGGTVVAGTARIASAGSTLTVTQSSNRAIVNWQGFSINSGEVTRLDLPSASAAILNRVTGNDPSILLGKLSSNGQVYLINPHGVVVGPSGVINTAAFVASTLDLPNSAFMQGGSLKFSGGSTATITNYGTIKTSAGDVALIGLDVDNQGKIQAPVGNALLAAGSEVLYVPDGQSAVAIQPSTAPASVTNTGVIAAASAQLRAAGSAYALAVNNGGEISATTVDQSGGQVVLDGGAGEVANSGTVDATGAEGVGGNVALSGGRVAVSGAVDASGATGGGSITVAATNDIAVTNAATLLADATDAGDGGQISVKAGQATEFDGIASARGGSNGGNGGSAEISGDTLGFSGSVDLTAPKGKTGSLLLDPTTITIDSSSTLLPSDATGGIWTYTEDVGSQTVGATAIDQALNSANLTLQATSSITVNAAISPSSLSSNTLELDSPTVTLNAGISIPYGNLTLDGTGSAGTALGPSLSSVSGAEINVSALNIDGYAQTALAGQVDAGTLAINQEGLAATSFSAANVNNILSAVTFGQPSGGGDSYSGSVNVYSSAPAMTVGGVVDAAGGLTIASVGNLTVSAPTGSSTQFSSSGGQITLASTGGAFINDIGTSLFSGSGRRVIYSYSDASPYTAGGLLYPNVGGVTYASDPDSTLTDVIYFYTSLPALTITANDASRYYGQVDPAFSFVVSGGVPLQIDPTVSVVGPDTNAGTYALVPSGAVASGYEISYVNGTLTVNPWPLTVTPDLSFTYGGTMPSTLPSSDFSSFVNGDSPTSLTTQPTLSTTATSSSGAGSYTITASGATDPNYVFSYKSGTVTINQAPLTITPNLSFTYGGTMPASLPPSDFSGFVNGDSLASLTSQPTFTTLATSSSGAGVYAISASGAVDPNYIISYGTGLVTVNRAPLTVVGNPATMFYGGSEPALTGTFTGLVNGDTPSSAGFSFYTYIPSSQFVAGASYPILLSANSSNYLVTSDTVANLSVVANPIVTVHTTTTTMVNNNLSTALTNSSLLTNGNTAINTNDTGGTQQSVTVNNPNSNIKLTLAFQLKNFMDMGMSNAAAPEELAILKAYVAAMAGSSPVVTLNSLIGQLMANGVSAVPIKAQLMPFVYAQLNEILDKPQSQWTKAEAAFVAGMQAYITEQRKVAAAQAMNAYAQWETQQQEQMAAKLAPYKMNGQAYIYAKAALSSNPPIPPSTFLQMAQGGTALTAKQAFLKLAIEITTSADDTAAIQEEGQRAQAEVTWMLANTTDPSVKASLEQFKNDLDSSDSTTVIEADLKIEQAYKNASGPSNVPGLTAGSIADVGHALMGIIALSGKAQGDSVVRLADALGVGKSIFPARYANASVNGGIGRVVANIEDAAGESEYTTARGVSKEVSELSDTLESIESVGDAAGPVGLGLELVGNVVQAAVGVADYVKVGNYNQAFANAVNADDAPVTVADMKAMLNSGAGQQQMMGYIASSMAVGTSALPDDVPQTSIAAIDFNQI